MRGQVTVFIILGIMLLFVFTWLAHITLTASAEMPADQERVHAYVTSCLQAISEDALVVFGKQGRLTPLAQYEPLYLEYYQPGSVPTREQAAVELKEYVDEHLPLCIDGFSSFDTMQFTEIGAPSTSVTLGDTSVSFDLTYDLTFGKKNVEYHLDTFSATVDVPLALYLAQADHLISHYADTTAVDNSYALPNGQYLEVHQHNKTLVFGLFDNATLVSGSPYLLAWAVEG